MQISETRVKLVGNRNDRLKAFCSITFDDNFVVRDLKIIEGTNGYFVAMPSRKLTDRCPSCGSKNHLRARYCNECGNKLGDNRAGQQDSRSTKLHADIAHPVNTETRQFIQERVVQDYHQEVERSKQPGYQPPKMDDEDDYAAEDAPVSQTTDASSDPAEDGSQTPQTDTQPDSEPDTKNRDSDSDFGKGIFS